MFIKAMYVCISQTCIKSHSLSSKVLSQIVRLSFQNINISIKSPSNILGKIEALLTLFRLGRGGGRGQKDPPTSFSTVTSTNVRFGPQNFLTFSSNSFATLVQNFKFVPTANPKLLNLNQDHPPKKANFLVKSRYDNFATVTKLCSHDHVYNMI